MQFSNLEILLSLSVASLAAPIELVGRAKASTKAATGSSVLTAGDYSTFQVSDGVAGNALAEVNAKFPIDTSNLAAVSAFDLAIISSAAQISEDAETGTGGFNDAIAAAGGQTTTAGAALQLGKIKNKVLKLQTDVLGI